jgi:hypothetical protein
MKMLRQSHPYTDVSQLKKKIDVSCINISCGYYNMHTKNEFVCLSDVEDAINTAVALVEEFGYERQTYQYEPPKFTQYSMFNVDDLEDEDDEAPWYEEEEIESEYNHIMYDYGALNITSKITGESIFLDEDEVEKIYNVLREKFMQKYWDV